MKSFMKKGLEEGLVSQVDTMGRARANFDVNQVLHYLDAKSSTSNR